MTGTPLIHCQGLIKRYGRTTAIDNLNLELYAGEPIALIGPNGAGKTTLLSLLCGFIRPNGGQAQVLGHNVGSKALNGLLAALPQDALLDPRRSVVRQLREFSRLQGFQGTDAVREVDRVLDIVDLSDAASMKPDTLSHGMRKRIALAQALIGSPALVLLDEPTAGIDPPNVRIIRDLIRQQSSHMTFVISSHNLDELEKLCGTVVYLEKGKLLRSGALVQGDDSPLLTLRLGDVPADRFLSMSLTLPGIIKVRQQVQGDWLLEVSNEASAAVAIMQLLERENWPFKSLTRGRSLEEQLYG
ncbi:MAG: ABC transporter ATP-binding protein [Granulosicoccus sp.]